MPPSGIAWTLKSWTEKYLTHNDAAPKVSMISEKQHRSKYDYKPSFYIFKNNSKAFPLNEKKCIHDTFLCYTFEPLYLWTVYKIWASELMLLISIVAQI